VFVFAATVVADAVIAAAMFGLDAGKYGLWMVRCSAAGAAELQSKV